MTEQSSPRTLEVDVETEVYEYLKEWADAVGCEVEEVASDAIYHGVKGKL